MQIPQTITIDNHSFDFIKKCNNNLYLYQETNLKYKECFTLHQLGLVKETVIPEREYTRNIIHEKSYELKTLGEYYGYR